AKVAIREIAFNGLSDPSNKIRVTAAYVVSRIAQNDWPEGWPNLLDLLISLLKSGSPDRVHGAIRVMTEFVKSEITEQQFAQVAPLLLPELSRILQCEKIYSYRTRGRAIAIFRQCIEILYMIKEEHSEATETFLTTPVIPEWLQIFVNILKQRTTDDEEREYGEYGLKLEVVKMTEEQVELWLSDANQFVADDDDETFNFSVRVASGDLLTVLLDQFPEQTLQSLADSTLHFIEESNNARSSGDPIWWKIQEACLKAIGFVSSELTAALQDSTSKVNFDLPGLFGHVVLGHLTATVVFSQYASLLPNELISRYVSATVGAIQQDGTIPVKISALRALQNFCRYLDDQYVAPFQSNIIEGVARLLNVTSGDSLILVLETIHEAIKINNEVTARYEHLIGPLIIDVWTKYPIDHTVASIVADIFETLASNPDAYAAFQARTLPPLANILLSNSDPAVTAYIAKALQPNESETATFLGDLVIKLIKKAGDKLLPVLPDLLKAVAAKLEGARTATFIQSLILIFAHVILNQQSTVIEFLANLDVNGRSPNQYTCVSAHTKIIKLLLSDLQNSPDGDNQKRSELDELLEEEEAVETDDEVEDDEWEDVEEPSPFAPSEDYIVLSEYVTKRDLEVLEDDDLDASDDPIYNTNLKVGEMVEYLMEFFRHCATQNINNFAQICSNLNQEEQHRLQYVISGRQI
ncbi:15476_t:CDS:10, partial [Acaulospora colombiana]